MHVYCTFKGWSGENVAWNFQLPHNFGVSMNWHFYEIYEVQCDALKYPMLKHLIEFQNIQT